MSQEIILNPEVLEPGIYSFEQGVPRHWDPGMRGVSILVPA
jgi:hypothetical protein